MKFNVAFTAIAAFFSAVEACKCGSIDSTRACCTSSGGTVSGNDCPASQISERLSTFASCCNNLGSRSDCRCPVGCARRELDAARAAQGLTMLSDAEVLAYVESYDGVDA